MTQSDYAELYQEMRRICYSLHYRNMSGETSVWVRAAFIANLMLMWQAHSDDPSIQRSTASRLHYNLEVISAVLATEELR